MKYYLNMLRIAHPEIAWHTVSIILHVFGAMALLGFIAGMPWWTWPFSLTALAITFYSGYYFEIGYRTRRFEEFRYEKGVR